MFFGIPALIAMMLFCSMSVRADGPEESHAPCAENKCTILKPRSDPPRSLVRVVNAVLRPDGMTRLDKGSGVIVQSKGETCVMSAAHIFREGVGEITIHFQNGDSLPASLHLKDSTCDIVLLKTDSPLNVDPLRLSLEAAKPGETTTAWGFGPQGHIIGQKGVVVGYVQTREAGSYETLKTTGRAREGDSGGPVLDRNGRMIGLLWGTDGRHTYSTCSERLGKILDLMEPESLENHTTPMSEEKHTLPPAQTKEERNTGMKNGLLPDLYRSRLLRNAATALGITSPAAFVMYMIWRMSRRCLFRKRGMKSPAEVSESVLNDEYATQLNSLYELSGHSSTADATLGRLYDIKLRDAEQSSSGELAKHAKMLRKQVADQFLRIHSRNPAPAETKR